MSQSFAGPLSSIALCWRIERADGAGLALTSHDRPLTIDGVAYEASPGMLPAAVQKRSGIEPGGAEVAGAISSSTISEEDLTLGRWDRARLTLTAVDWEHPEAEQIRLTGGELGEIRFEQGRFQAELRGAAAKLEAAVCPATSPECRAELGDRQCRMDMAGRFRIAIVQSANGREIIFDEEVGDGFLWGRARFLTGANCGLLNVVVGVDGNWIELRDFPRAPIATGDRIELRHGCDKSFATCIGRFGNAANFRGEPHLPGNDLLTRFPGA